MNILRSIEARRKNYLLHHFEKTRYGKNLYKLANKYCGKRCFIIGNGPSLKARDLDRLVDEYTFAFNRIYYIFSETVWRPTFYCTQDEKIIKNSLYDILKEITTPYIFAPISLKWYSNVDLETQFYFSPKQAKKIDEYPSFSENIAHEIGVGNTITYTAMQIAVYMGFSEIYLLGVDHSFHQYQNMDGKIITDPAGKDYFCAEYNTDQNNLYIPNLDLSLLSYLAARQYSEKHNISIYNATRGGKLEIFPRIDFDLLFE